MSRVMQMMAKFGRVAEYTVMRDKNGEVRVKGKRQPDVYEEFKISASIQPMGADEVLDESVGSERNRHGIRIYSDVPLKVADPKTGFKSDIIIFRGEKFEIQKVEDWTHSNLSLKHYKSMAMLKNS